MTIRNENIVFVPVTGPPTSVLSTLRRKVAGLVRSDRVVRFKIGRTNDFVTRMAAYSDYHEIVIVYRSESIEHANTVERELTEHFNDSDNLVRGGGGPPGGGPYFIYVVVKYHRGVEWR